MTIPKQRWSLAPFAQFPLTNSSRGAEYKNSVGARGFALQQRTNPGTKEGQAHGPRYPYRCRRVDRSVAAPSKGPARNSVWGPSARIHGRLLPQFGGQSAIGVGDGLTSRRATHPGSVAGAGRCRRSNSSSAVAGTRKPDGPYG